MPPGFAERLQFPSEVARGLERLKLPPEVIRGLKLVTALPPEAARKLRRLAA